MAESIDTTTMPKRNSGAIAEGFSFHSALSLAFADVSPIAAVYAIFTLACSPRGRSSSGPSRSCSPAS